MIGFESNDTCFFQVEYFAMELCTLGTVEANTGGKALCNGRILKRDEISTSELRLLRIRSGIQKRKKQICQAHLKKWVESYSSHQLFCCDPFETHPRETKGKRAGQVKSKGTFEISLELRDKAKCAGIVLVPGKKLCPACKMKLVAMLKERSTISPKGIVRQ